MKTIIAILTLITGASIMSLVVNEEEKHKKIEGDFYYILIDRTHLGGTDIHPKTGISYKRLNSKIYVAKNNMFLATTYLGETVENCSKRIPIGIYKGNIRRLSSSKKVIVNSEDILATKGDFLLEVQIIEGDINDSEPPNYSDIDIDKNKARTNILFHSGNRAYHSEGCILTGPFPKNGKLTDDHLLKKLRNFIQGDDITSHNNYNILIEIRQNQTWHCN